MRRERHSRSQRVRRAAHAPSLERVADIPRYWAELAPDSAALWEAGCAISFAELQRGIDAVVKVLGEHGLRAGDRVMLVAENSPAQVALIYGISAAGAWPVVVNARLSEREIEAIRAHCEPRLLVFTSTISEDAARHARRYGAAVLAKDVFGGFDAAPAEASPRSEPPETASAVALLLYTSGTTGKPKGVMVAHRGLLHFCGTSVRARALTPTDRVYAVLPISHIFGLATQLLATHYGGASVWLERHFDPERTLAAMENDGISILQGVPTLFVRLLAHLHHHRGQARFPHLRYAYTGGGPLDANLKRDFEAAFGLPLHHGYGMTEYAGSMFVTRIDRPRRDCSAGEINDGCEIRLVDANARDVAPGEPGEIWIRGPGVMLGYYRDPEQTQLALQPGGWLVTGDIGRLEADGALFILGRSKDLIIRSGFNVYPIEVESVLHSHPAVRQSAVVGRSTEDHNEEVIAFVEPRAGATLDVAELAVFLRNRLAPYKRPSEIVVVDTLPLTPNGKVRKQELRARRTPHTRHTG